MPLLTHAGLPNTADGPAHLMRQVELNQAWQQGTFYLRWGADLALGHGMPIFNYTPRNPRPSCRVSRRERRVEIG
jgi:hypothetical protein